MSTELSKTFYYAYETRVLKSTSVLRRLVYLHSGGSVCMAKARYCLAEALVCRVGGSLRPGVPSLVRQEARCQACFQQVDATK